MKQGMTLQEMAQKVAYVGEHKQDYVLPINSIDFGRNSNGEYEYYAGVRNHGGIGGTINNHALSQMTTAMNIPASFVSVLKEEDPDYLPELMNRRAHKNSTNRMLRTVNTRMVAAVSPSFSRDYDNDTILKAVLPTILESGLETISANVSETHMHLKVLSPKLRGEVSIGDAIRGGLTIGNSDVGLSRAFINQLIYRLVCLNGMARPETTNAYGRVHRGSRQPEGILYRQETVAALQQAIAMEMADTVKFLLSEQSFNNTIEQLKQTKENKLTGKNLDEAVKELGKIIGFNQTEGDSILQHLIEGGDLSQYGLMNAVTRYSQDVEDYDRATNLEQLGGKVITLSPRQWKTIVSVQEAA